MGRDGCGKDGGMERMEGVKGRARKGRKTEGKGREGKRRKDR